MHVVLDTNILVRAAPGRTGPARELLEMIAESPHMLVSSPPLLEELAEALDYPRLRALHGLDDAGIVRYATDIEALGWWYP